MTVKLVKDDWSIGVSPDQGGVLKYVRHLGRDILRPADGNNSDPLLSSCYPCVPWFGRLYEPLPNLGNPFHVGLTNPSCDPTYPIHGYGWVRSWSVSAQTNTALTCDLFFHPQREDDFPYSFEASQSVELTEDGLTMTLSLNNNGDKAMPVGLALHPFFPKHPTTLLKFDAESFWTPPGDASSGINDTPPHFDFSAAKPLPPDGLDHSFMERSSDITVMDEGLCIMIKTDAPHLHVFAPENADFFCLEPITQLPGAFGEHSLQPNETHKLTMSISVI